MIKKCQYCGKTFSVHLSRIKEERGKFCNIKCYKLYRKSNKIKKKCKYCKKVFSCGGTRQIYCKRKCYLNDPSPKKLKLDEQKINEMYKNGFFIWEIAKKFKCGKTTIRRRLKIRKTLSEIKKLTIQKYGLPKEFDRTGKYPKTIFKKGEKPHQHGKGCSCFRCTGNPPNKDKKLEEWRTDTQAKSMREKFAKNALNSDKKNRERKPYIWKGVHFASKAEMEVAKKLLKKPIEGVNYQIKAGMKKIDFLIQKKVFIEYHPNLLRKQQTKEEYILERNLAKKKSKYPRLPIDFILTNKELNKQIKDIKKKYKLRY